jgi:hypothetical protein
LFKKTPPDPLTFKNLDRVTYFSGHYLKESDYFQEICRECGSKNNKLLYYINHTGSGEGNIKPHEASLCMKCKKGFFCSRVIK